ncbi:hypothetical protein KAR91_05630 [Candidatus Pacearchaeota archaeon]|nr:hypothetical protein [Candidatus Pacearchaeota archaeon]
MSKITDSAKGSICIKCQAPGAYVAHYNGPRQHSFGKGRGRKCHDLMSAEFCHRCDQEFTEGSTGPKWKDKWERSEDFMYWIGLTNIRRYEEGRI